MNKEKNFDLQFIEEKAKEVASLFTTDLAQAQKYETGLLDELISPLNKNFVLFGSGGLGKKILKGLRSVGIEPLAFADNNKNVWGQSIDGIPVYSPADAVEKFGAKIPFVVSIWGANSSTSFLKIKSQLTEMGCAQVVSFVPLFWK